MKPVLFKTKDEELLSLKKIAEKFKDIPELLPNKHARANEFIKKISPITTPSSK